MSDVALWLKGLGLERYADTFAANEIDFATLPELTEEDLKELGLPIGPRRRVLNAILTLRTAPSSSGETKSAKPASLSNILLAAELSEAPAERRQVTVAFCDLVGSTRAHAAFTTSSPVRTARSASSSWAWGYPKMLNPRLGLDICIPVPHQHAISSLLLALRDAPYRLR